MLTLIWYDNRQAHLAINMATFTCPSCGDPVPSPSQPKGLPIKCGTCGESIRYAKPLAKVVSFNDSPKANFAKGAKIPWFWVSFGVVSGGFMMLVLLMFLNLGKSRQERENEQKLAAAFEVIGKQPSFEVFVKKQKDEEQFTTIEYRELMSAFKSGQKWRAVVVKHGTTKEELIALARRLHKEDRASNVRFFDDDAQYDAFRLHDENYPNPNFPSPEKWVRSHYLAHLFAFKGNGNKWELWNQFASRLLGEDELIAVIE